VIASDGKIIWFTGDGNLIICKADPSGFDTEGRAPHQMTFEKPMGGVFSGPRGCPVLADGLMYCRNYGTYTEINYKDALNQANLICLSFGERQLQTTDHTDERR